MKSQHPIPLLYCVLYSCLLITLLWLIRSVDMVLGIDLSSLGIYPHDISYLTGILTAPFIHGSTEHLFTNSLPLFIMFTTLLYQFPRSAIPALLIITLGSGSGVWLLAREAIHYGASGVNHGLMFYLFLMGILRRDRPSMAIAMMVFFLYGGMVWGILPSDPDVSYEYHLFGAVSGLVAAALLYRRDPKIPGKTYSWERAEDTEDDPVIGDLWKQASAPEEPIYEEQEEEAEKLP